MLRTLGAIGIALLAIGCERVFSLDRTPIDARMLSPGCSGMRMLADAFADGTLDPLWPEGGADPGITVGETGGALQVAMSNHGYADVHSMRYFDLRDDHFSLEVRALDDVFPAGGRVEINLDAPSGQGGLRMTREGTMLHMYRATGGDQFEVGAIPYDAVAHRFWRMARTGDDVTWETSPDDQTYTTQATVPGLTWARFLRARIRTYRDPTDGPFTMLYDQVNGGTPMGDACKTFGLTDDFEDGVIGEQWARGYGDLRTEQNGRLSMGLAGTGGYDQGFVQGAAFYDLRDDAVLVEVPQVPAAGSDVRVYLDAFMMDGTGIQLGYHASTGELRATTSAAPTGNKPYDAATDRWWRIRAAGDRLYWETSPDGVTFTQLGTTTAPAGLDRVDVSFGIYGTVGTPVTAQFDNFNLPPQ